MDAARDYARQGCAHFTVFVAERQNAGRGRLKRVWLSEDGGLYFTIVLRPQIPPALSFRFNFAASLSLARTLRNMFGINAKVKWPNDILADDKKISGMLSETEIRDESVSYLNIGIGINVNNDPATEEPNATSLKKRLNRKISRKELLAGFLDAFEAQTARSDLDQIISHWKKYTLTIGRHVKVVTAHDVSEGLATDVDEDGSLVLQLEDGTIKKIIYGDCFHAPLHEEQSFLKG